MRYILIVCMAMLLGPLTAQTVSADDLKEQGLYINAHQSMLLGDYDDAIATYEQILEQDPANAAVHHDLARIYLAQKNVDKATQSAKKATRLAPDEIWYRHTLADIYRMDEEYTAEAEQLRQIISQRQDERLYEKWVSALLAAGQQSDAITAYDEMMRTYGMKESWVDTSIDLYLGQKDTKGAESLLKRYIDNAPYRLDRRVKLGEYYMYRQQYKKAQKVFDQVLQDDPANDKALFNKRILDNRQRGGDDPVLSITSDPSLSMDERIARLIPMVARLSADRSLQPALETGVGRLLEIAPQNAKLHALLGDIDYMTDETDAAVAHYRQALTIDPSVYSIWSNLLACLETSDDHQRLADQAEETIDYYPNIAEPYYYYALALWRLEKGEEAKEYIEEAELIDSDDAQLTENIAILSAQMLYASDRQAAIKRLVDHQSEYGASARLSELIGDLYRQNGDGAKAQEYWQNAIDLGADRERITAKIASL